MDLPKTFDTVDHEILIIMGLWVYIVDESYLR